MKLFGWTLIIMLSLAPAIAWLLLGPASTYEMNYENLTHFTGQVTGLIGMTLFALTFVLATRLSVLEDLFGGLDKVYIVHSWVGATAFILLLFHPVFLVLKYIPKHMDLAAEYLLISEYNSVNFGIAALIGLSILLFITFYLRWRYQHWKLSHKFLGVTFALAVLHIMLVRNDIARDNIFTGYFVYALAVSIIGIAAFFYALILKEMRGASYIVEKIDITGNVHDITLVPVSRVVKTRAGQFVFLSFRNGILSSEPHPFSVASHKGLRLRVVIKSLGDFTSTLKAVKTGQKVWVEGPYGRFFGRSRRELWVAGGIGITPFLGMAEELPENGKDVDLFYTVAKDSDLVGIDELRRIEKRCKDRFRVHIWISDRQGRLTMDSIRVPLAGREFFLCGPPGLKSSIKEGLIRKGVKRSLIHDEEFRFK